MQNVGLARNKDEVVVRLDFAFLSIQYCTIACSESTQSREPSVLNFSQRSTTAEEGYAANRESGWQRLKQVPRRVVHEEDSFHCEDGAEEENMGDW